MDVYKIDQSLGSLGSGVAEVKVTNPEVTFDTNTDFNLSFFDPSSSPPPGVIKKEDFDDRNFDSVAPDSLFSPSADYSPFTTEESKYTSFSDTAQPYAQDSASSLSPASTPTLSSPLPSPSPGLLQAHNAVSQMKAPLVIKKGTQWSVVSQPLPSLSIDFLLSFYLFIHLTIYLSISIDPPI